MSAPLVNPQSRTHRAQRGVVLVFALIALVIMMIGAVAITRSMNTSQFMIGNIGFKRDLSRQGDRAIQRALDTVRSGALSDINTRNADLITENYKATVLPTDSQGIPLALLNDATFATVGTSAKDIPMTDLGVVLRYVVDRMSSGAGPCSASTCVYINQDMKSGSANELQNSQNDIVNAGGGGGGGAKGAVPIQEVYRLTVRATGPRNTQAFFQSTFTSP